MSFDLYFVPRPAPGEGWDAVMERLEAAASDQRQPSPEDRELWDRIVAAAASVVPDGEVFDGERSRTFDDGVAIQLSMYPGEVSINTPYWFEGPDAEQVVERLKAIAVAIEEATGLVAYDPQADAAFLDAGAAAAPGTFDRAHDFMANELGVTAHRSAQRPWWAFWRRSQRS